jgi:hypothetical protein
VIPIGDFSEYLSCVNGNGAEDGEHRRAYRNRELAFTLHG